MRYSDYKCFRFGFDPGVAYVSIDHPPINLLDEVLSQEFDKLGRELETDASVRVVVLQSALPDFFITRRSSVSLSDLHEFGAIRRASLAPPVCADHTSQGRQRRLKLRKESLWGT